MKPLLRPFLVSMAVLALGTGIWVFSQSLWGTSSARQDSVFQATVAGFRESLRDSWLFRPDEVIWQMEQAVDTGDHGEILRAFHESIYGHFTPPHEVAPALRAYLTHPSAYVRYQAAECLYTIGDLSGRSALLEIVKSPISLPGSGQDLRIKAACLLAQHREFSAAPQIANLYSRTKAGELLPGLATLHVRANEATQWPYVPGPSAIRAYVATGDQRFLPELKATFTSTSEPKVKNAAAWAMAVFTGEERYVQYLVDTAGPAITEPPGGGGDRFQLGQDALRYLGSLSTPLARHTLERALESNHPTLVPIAIVNLSFNQPTLSPKARQFIIQELKRKHSVLQVELLLDIASKLRDPAVCTAGKAYNVRSSNRLWSKYAVERRQWPIYNWIDDYVVLLMPDATAPLSLPSTR